jgi:hypothetical protein
MAFGRLIARAALMLQVCTWQSLELRMKIATSCIIAASLLALVVLDASAANFGGKFDFVQTDASSSTGTLRYYNSAQGLHVFAAPGSNATVLQSAFFRKAYVSIQYTAIVCPAGFAGTCGTLTYITVDASNIP